MCRMGKMVCHAECPLTLPACPAPPACAPPARLAAGPRDIRLHLGVSVLDMVLRDLRAKPEHRWGRLRLLEEGNMCGGTHTAACAAQWQPA